MFVKKGLLFATALALMVFVGQASAQDMGGGMMGGDGMMGGGMMGPRATLTVDGKTIVRGVGANQDIVVQVSVSGVTGDTNGASITFDGHGNATLKNFMPASGFLAPGGMSGNMITLIGLPPKALTDGFSFGTATLTTGANVTADTEFSIGVSVGVNTQGMMAPTTVSGSLMVNKPAPTLTADHTEVMIPRGMMMTGSATVTAMGFTGTVMLSSDPAGAVNSDGTVTASEPGVVTVTATDGIDPVMPSVMISFIATPYLMADHTAVTIPHGEAGMATVTVMDAVAGAEISFDVQGAGVMSEVHGGMVNVSATHAAEATVTATVNGYTTEAVTVSFTPAPVEARADMNPVTVPRGGSVMVTISTVGFPADADVKYSFTASAGITSSEAQGMLMLTATMPGSVTVTATDGMLTTAGLVVNFLPAPPELIASSMNAVIPSGGTAHVNISAVGFGANAQVSYSINKISGSANITNAIIDATTLQLAASGAGGAVVEVSASDGMMMTSTHPIRITFWAMPTVSAGTDMVMVSGSPIGSTTVIASGFPSGAEVVFHVEMVSGVEGSVTYTHVHEPQETLTLTASGAAVVSVTASDGTTTTAPVTVTFTQDSPAAPSSLVVQDQPSDNGYYVMVSFSNSEDHASVNQYRIYREMDSNTENQGGMVRPTDDPNKVWVPWAVVDAIPSNDNTTRAVIPVTDGMATRWGVAAEKGMDSSEVTASGKRVFTKESVQAMAEVLGLDPNRVVSHEELTQMFMPSADYIKSIIGDRKNVVFAALDPDLSVLMGGDVNIPQNIRTGSGPILSSPMVMTENAVAAEDNMAPAAVTDVAVDVETGTVTWTLSADDMAVGAIEYRGFAIPIHGVIGYKVMGGASADAMIDIGVVAPGMGSFQVPAELVQSLIDRGVPAVLVSVVAMDGTHMTASVPLVVELAPTRRAFVDADGGPVYIVKLDGSTPQLVDFEDFIAFTEAFNTDESNENWRVFIQADLNDDGMVDFEDFILFFSSYGKEATGPAGKSLIPPLGVNENAEFNLSLGSDRVVAGETMFVDVSLANVQALMGYGFVLHYDAEKFEFVEAMPAAEDLLKSAGGETPLFKGWSAEAGQVRVMNAIANGAEVSGGGEVVRLVFRVLRNFEENARFEIAEGLVFDPSQLANPLAGGVLDIQTTPTEFALLQNFPNPFNPETTIGYELAESADVTLQIYNVVGQVVRTLMASEPQSVGRYQVRWDGMDDRGMPVSSGIYFYQLSAGKFQDVRKLMLLK